MAPRTKFEAPNLSNATDSFLADELGKLSIIENYAKKLRGFYKDALYARKGINTLEAVAPVEIPGEIFVIQVSQYPSSRLDTTAFKEDHPELYEKYLKKTDITRSLPLLKQGATNPIVGALIDQLKAELNLDD